MLRDSVQCRQMGVRWNVIPWRLDMLKFPALAGEALAEAMDAHLIVFAGRCAQSIPSSLKSWLEHWAKCRRITDAALAVMSEASNDPRTSSTSPELSRFATRHGLNFIYDGNVAGVPSATEDRLPFGIRTRNEISANPYWTLEHHRRNAVLVR